MVELTYLSLKKTTFFCSYFRHISLCFYSNFDRESSLDAEFDSASNEYPHYILLMDTATPKTINTWKMWWWCQYHIFLGISCFWGSGVRQKYAVWVLVGCGIHHHHIFQVFLIFGVAGSIKSMLCGYSHPTSSPNQNLSKNTMRYVKNTNKKSSFF